MNQIVLRRDFLKGQKRVRQIIRLATKKEEREFQKKINQIIKTLPNFDFCSFNSSDLSPENLDKLALVLVEIFKVFAPNNSWLTEDELYRYTSHVFTEGVLQQMVKENSISVKKDSYGLSWYIEQNDLHLSKKKKKS